MQERIARRLRIDGLVQGVGYRAWCREEAESRALAGWVRNRPDGSVEALIAGPPESVTAMIEACRAGPPAARVETVEAEATGDIPQGGGFRILA